MKKIALLATALVLSLGAAFAAPVEVSLAYPVAVDAPITTILKGWVADYQVKNPDVKVNLIFSGGYPDVKTAVQTAIQGGAKAPTLAVMLATDVYDLVNAKYVDSLDDLAAAAPNGKAFVADFLPAYMGNSTYKGKLWSLPFQRSAVVLYYNADLLAANKIAAPKSWDELGRAAQALTVDAGKTRWGIEIPTENPYWTFQPLAIGAGKNVFTDDVTVNFNDPDDYEPCDHEQLWVGYHPETDAVTEVRTFFHGRLLGTPEATVEANAHGGRPRIRVEWGLHGSLVAGWEAIRFADGGSPESWLDHNFRGVKVGGRAKNHPLKKRWPAGFAGEWDDYLDFTSPVDSVSLLREKGLVFVSRWATATLQQHGVPYNFAVKYDWPFDMVPLGSGVVR